MDFRKEERNEKAGHLPSHRMPPQLGWKVCGQRDTVGWQQVALVWSCIGGRAVGGITGHSRGGWFRGRGLTRLRKVPPLTPPWF